MVRQHYSEAEEQRYGLFTVDPGKESNALIGEIHLSGQTGVVSPLHLMITEAEEQARRRGHANGAAQLLPEDVYIDQITLFPDTLDMRSWLGLGTMHVLDKFIPGWEDMSSQMLREPAFIDKWRFNEGFRKDLAAAYVMQEQHLLSLLGNHFEMRFEQQMPKDPIVFASLRRATSYKIGLIAEFLRRANIIDGIGRKLDRPIYYLFGGLAHQDDSESIDALQNLLRHMERINQEFEFFKANFLIGYDFELAKWIFPGLARRGCWVGATNPIGAGRSQDTEAFGPSYMKASLNGMRILGTHDGGAACLSYLPTVSLYGPATFAGDTSFHNDLWSNEALQRNSRVLLAQGFVSGLARVAGFIDQDLLRIEAGQACRTMGMDNQIASMFTLMADWNGRVLMDTYLDR